MLLLEALVQVGLPGIAMGCKSHDMAMCSLTFTRSYCCFPCGDAFPGSPELPMLHRGWRMSRAEKRYFPEDQDPLQAISVETKDDDDAPDHSSEYGIIIFTCIVTVMYLVVQVRDSRCGPLMMTPWEYRVLVMHSLGDAPPADPASFLSICCRILPRAV